MHQFTVHVGRRASRRSSLSRVVLALLCIVGLCASLLQPPSKRLLLKTGTSSQAAFVKDSAIKAGKPCKRVVPDALGNSCISGALIGLEATTFVVLKPLSLDAKNIAFADMTLGAQWLVVPQTRPPRIFA